MLNTILIIGTAVVLLAAIVTLGVLELRAKKLIRAASDSAQKHLEKAQELLDVAEAHLQTAQAGIQESEELLARVEQRISELTTHEKKEEEVR